MTAERAVRAGYNEIQHMNMLFLNFMFDRCRTRARRRDSPRSPSEAADLDFDDPKTKDFIALLASKHITVDPTLQLFENLILDRAGEMATAYAPIADRLPPIVRRGLLEGGLPVTGEQEKRYQDSFAAMLHMLTVLHDAGVPIVAGTDSLGGFALIRELELYVKAGIPAPEVLQHGDARRGARGGAGRASRLDRARQARRLHPRGRRPERGSRRAAEPAPRREGRRAARAGGDVARARHPAAA